MKSLQSPFLVMPLWAAVSTGLVATSPAPAWAFAGAASWPLVEYVAHRYGMHGIERRWPKTYKRVHGVHHAYPSDISHFTIPIPAVAAVALGLLAVMWSLGAWGARAVVGGVLGAYVLYDLAHLAAHGMAPFPWSKMLATAHAAHHANPRVNFGVTSRAIDVVCGTAAKPSDALRVVIGSGSAGVAAFRAARARGGRVFAMAPPGDPLAIEAGASNVTDPGGAMLVVFADEVIDAPDITETRP